MALSGRACDTRCQAFLTSVIQNENAARMKWFIKNQDRLLKNLEDSKLTQKIENIKSISGISKRSEERKKSQEGRKERVNLEDRRKIDTFLKPEKDGVFNISVMRPLDSKIKNILYASGVETNTAARQYLHERYKEKPEDRFYYPECTSWNYGWRLKDHRPIPASLFGNRSIVETSFYSRDGLTRDPDWYKMCQSKNPKNFNEILTS